MKPLTELFHDHIARSIDKEGIRFACCLHMSQEDKLTMMALDLTPEQIYQAVRSVIVKDKPKELVFGLDRFCKAGQGTTLADCITGAHWTGGPLWQPFIIEYQYEPRIVLSINWSNAFWNRIICDDLTYFRLEAP